MSRDIESLSRIVDAELDRFAPLLASPPLSEQTADRVRRAVSLAAANRRRFAWLRVAPPLVAAVAMFAALLPMSRPIPLPAPAVLDPDQAIVDWSAAYAESADRVAALYGDEFLPESLEDAEDAGSSGFDALDSFEESMETFERILGA